MYDFVYWVDGLPLVSNILQIRLELLVESDGYY
jgi:hypothetical protein